MLPESLSELQHLSGLKLVTEAYHSEYSSVKMLNRLINGLGENVLEVDFIVNDMIEILQASLQRIVQ